MYTINIKHKGNDEPTTYTIYQEKEAKSEGVDYIYWKSANCGDYALSDDKYVAKVLAKHTYPGIVGSIIFILGSLGAMSFTILSILQKN